MVCLAVLLRSAVRGRAPAERAIRPRSVQRGHGAGSVARRSVRSPRRLHGCRAGRLEFGQLGFGRPRAGCEIEGGGRRGLGSRAGCPNRVRLRADQCDLRPRRPTTAYAKRGRPHGRTSSAAGVTRQFPTRGEPPTAAGRAPLLRPESARAASASPLRWNLVPKGETLLRRSFHPTPRDCRRPNRNRGRAQGPDDRRGPHCQTLADL